jgi:hypothetical protein
MAAAQIVLAAAADSSSSRQSHQHSPPLAGQRLSSRRWGLQRRRTRPLQTAEPASGQQHAAPEVPLPSDDQASTIYTALATGSYDEEAFEEAQAAFDNSQKASPPQENGSGGAAQQEEQQQPVAHRWQVVGMMCASFVLANFDKVGAAGIYCMCWLQPKDRKATLMLAIAGTAVPALETWTSLKLGGLHNFCHQPFSERLSPPSQYICHSNAVLLTSQLLCLLGVGEHVGGCDPHGQGLGLVGDGEGPGVLRLLLGILPHTDPCRLAVHQVCVYTCMPALPRVPQGTRVCMLGFAGHRGCNSLSSAAAGQAACVHD